MRDMDIKWVILLIVGLLAMVYIIAATDQEGVKDGTLLPNGATNIVSVGDDWFEFSYKGKRLLYHRSGIGDHRVESLAVIGESR